VRSPLSLHFPSFAVLTRKQTNRARTDLVVLPSRRAVRSLSSRNLTLASTVSTCRLIRTTRRASSHSPCSFLLSLHLLTNNPLSQPRAKTRFRGGEHARFRTRVTLVHSHLSLPVRASYGHARSFTFVPPFALFTPFSPPSFPFCFPSFFLCFLAPPFAHTPCTLPYPTFFPYPQRRLPFVSNRSKGTKSEKRKKKFRFDVFACLQRCCSCR
jgi:hypothetical protein